MAPQFFVVYRKKKNKKKNKKKKNSRKTKVSKRSVGSFPEKSRNSRLKRNKAQRNDLSKPILDKDIKGNVEGVEVDTLYDWIEQVTRKTRKGEKTLVLEVIIFIKDL